MTEMPPTLREAICNRFILAQEATGLSKGDFASRVGLTSSQFSNIKNFRNPPSYEAIAAAVREFGFTSDWFVVGSRVGFRDEKLAERLRELEARQT
jgi:transcriptional regulator with XRE-family HTH domain